MSRQTRPVVSSCLPAGMPLARRLRFAQPLARLGVALVVSALVAAGSGASAQDLEPRSYASTPVGLNFLIAGYGYTSGGVATDPALPLQNAHLHIHSTVLAYARSLDV